MNKKTLVLGASENPARYGNIALKKLRAHGHDVIAIGRREGRVGDVAIHTTKPQVNDVDTVTLYMNAQNQKDYEAYILSLHPKRIIFNPGAENDALAEKAAAQGIQTFEACTLVMLSTGQY